MLMPTFSFVNIKSQPLLLHVEEQIDLLVVVPSSGTSAASWAVSPFFLTIHNIAVHTFDVLRRKKVSATVDSFLIDKSVISSFSL